MDSPGSPWLVRPIGCVSCDILLQITHWRVSSCGSYPSQDLQVADPRQEDDLMLQDLLSSSR